MNITQYTTADGLTKKGKREVVCGPRFGKAFCEQFGLAPEAVGCVTLKTGVDDIFGAEVFIVLTAEDIESIGKLMGRQD